LCALPALAIGKKREGADDRDGLREKVVWIGRGTVFSVGLVATLTSVPVAKRGAERG
jgi:hypothetical protein